MGVDLGLADGHIGRGQVGDQRALGLDEVESGARLSLSLRLLGPNLAVYDQLVEQGRRLGLDPLFKGYSS
jgi:hypothetical protein